MYQAFSMSNEPTIITNDPSWQFLIGTVKKLSFKDAQIVNIIYKCSGKFVYITVLDDTFPCFQNSQRLQGPVSL